MSKFQKYLKETIAELRKMTWPTKQELWGSTVITVVFSIVTSIFIGGVDWALLQLVRLIFSGGGQS